MVTLGTKNSIPSTLMDPQDQVPGETTQNGIPEKLLSRAVSKYTLKHKKDGAKQKKRKKQGKPDDSFATPTPSLLTLAQSLSVDPPSDCPLLQLFKLGLSLTTD